MTTVGFGGGCHWCTEAVFASLKGVSDVRQGWISSEGANSGFSEAVLLDFDPEEIDLETLIAIHLHTHASTSNHSMRGKYRSAIYFLDAETEKSAKASLGKLQSEFDKPVVTQVLSFADIRLNREDSLDYYFSDPDRPFCEVYINPKLQFLMRRFSRHLDFSKLGHLDDEAKRRS